MNMLDALTKSLMAIGINPLIAGAVIAAVIMKLIEYHNKKQYRQQAEENLEYMDRVRTLSAQALERSKGNLPPDENSTRYSWDGKILETICKGTSRTVTRNELEPVISLLKSNNPDDAAIFLNKNLNFDLGLAMTVANFLKRAEKI
jgi:hypothetical protein